MIDTFAPPRDDNPLSDGFWQQEKLELSGEFQELAMQVMLAGGGTGAAALDPALAVLIDWDMFNQDALWWLAQYFGMVPGTAVNVSAGAFAWAQTLTDYTRQQVVTEIDRWVRSGEPLPSLEARLSPLFGQPRAHRVAVTEVTRIYAHGNVAAWGASGVVGAKSWQTAVDERVCPICGPMHGQIVELQDSWKFTPEMVAANPQLEKLLRNQTAFFAPPAHVLCRCWLQPVVLEAYEPGELDGKWFNQPPAPVTVQPAQAAIKRTLKSVEDEIRTLDHEQAAVIDEFGKVVLRKRGQSRSVSFTPEEAELFSGRTFTHNHPHGRYGGATSFSRPDFDTTRLTSIKEMRAVGTRYDGRKVNFRLLVEDDEYYRLPKRTITTSYNNAEKKMWAEVGARIRSGEISVNEGNWLASDLTSRAFVDKINDKVGKTLLRYIVEVLD